MFTKILIANRGEIAVRIMATCREMGIRTVAIYSEADANAYHVRQADEAYCVGPAAASESYLRADTILTLARQCGAEAIHPGYGFLSENAGFAAVCALAGFVFIGPPVEAMRLMGSKITAKRLAERVEVPTVPGYHGDDQDDETLYRETLRVGFPLLIKASAGGGGKGMRTVLDPGDFLEQLAGARREALAAFGDEAVFLERLIVQPRHIEVQVLGDQYGNLIHLGERECSIQRRHQKILEESPSSVLTPHLRSEICSAALRVAREAGYVNAGTVEFMLDEDREHFYFLEMNTRLQVEHPVTELVSGVDLVRLQIAIAAGEPLTLTQEQVNVRGHAIEVRLYAEDPAQHFLPSTGTILRFIKPDGPGIRIDSGVEHGDEITPYYDPMIAKLIVSAADRESAIRRLQSALEQLVIFGVQTNLALLHAISIDPSFCAGTTTTDFLTTSGLLTAPEAVDDPPAVVLAGAALFDLVYHTRMAGMSGGNPWQQLGSWSMVGSIRSMTYTYQEREYRLLVQPGYGTVETWQVQIGDQSRQEITVLTGNDGLLLLRQGAVQERVSILRQPRVTLVAYMGRIYQLQRRQVPDVNNSVQSSAMLPGQNMLAAPMAGTIVRIQVHEGEQVESQQSLFVLSAMKMEHTISAPYAGTIQRILYQEGAVVQGGAVIVEMA